mgnify:CR=1 FL=1
MRFSPIFQTINHTAPETHYLNVIWHQLYLTDQTVDIICTASAVTVWTAVLTVAIGCFIVLLMNGSGYVADAYDLVHCERPQGR